MQLWRRVLAGSLGILGLAAFGYGQAERSAAGVEMKPSANVGQHPAHPRQPDTYGTAAVSYYNVDAWDLFPIGSGFDYFYLYGRFSGNCTGLCLGAALHLPAGAMLVSIELDYYIAPAGNAEVLLHICDYAGQNCKSPLHCGSFTVCSVFGKNYSIADLTGDGIQIDNFENRYYLEAGTSTTDGSTEITRISIGYVLQVSPGPTTATFTDVPTTHPFFKFVEALHAAGITGGYPDGRFGVDDPITRGQMAVFLATALGLQFP